MLIIARQMSNCETFGSVVLNKILFYADHIHYRDTGKKITDFTYVHQPQGPTPAPKEYMPIKDELIKNRDAKEKVRDYFGKPQKRLVAEVLPDYSVFSKEELTTLEKVIADFRTINGSSASEMTHRQELGWQLSNQMEEIPPYTFLLMEGDVIESDVAWGKTQLGKFNRGRALATNGN